MSTTPDFSTAAWRKSSYSNGGDANCVEIADGYSVTPVRDSKIGNESPVLAFPHDAWQAFVQSL